MRCKVYVVAAIALFGLAASPAAVPAADIIVSNLNETNDGNDTIGSGFAAAQEFMTGSSPYLLTQILANLGFLDRGTNNDFTLTATLQADDGGKPGSLLTSFTYDINSIPTVGFAHVAFDPVNMTVGLMPGASYWFVLNASPGVTSGGVDWSFTNSTNKDGPGTLPNFNTSNDNGSTWNGPFTGTPYQIQVSGTLVPEPTSWILGSIGFGGMLLATRWCRSRRRIV